MKTKNLFIGILLIGTTVMAACGSASNPPVVAETPPPPPTFDSQAASSEAIKFLQSGWSMAAMLKGVQSCADFDSKQKNFQTFVDNFQSSLGGSFSGNCPATPVFQSAELQLSLNIVNEFPDYEKGLTVKGQYTYDFLVEPQENIHIKSLKSDLTINGKAFDFTKAEVLIPLGDYNQPSYSGSVTVDGHTCQLIADGSGCQF